MTVKFEDCLVNLLRPLGVYDLRSSTINRGAGRLRRTAG